MKDFSKKEKTIVLFCAVTVLFSVTVLIGQIRLSNYVNSMVSAGENASVTINWFEESTAVSDISDVSDASEFDIPKHGKRYIVNISSKKIHSPDCQYAADISDENSSEIYTDNLSEYLDKGYSICSKCNAE